MLVNSRRAGRSDVAVDQLPALAPLPGEQRARIVVAARALHPREPREHGRVPANFMLK